MRRYDGVVAGSVVTIRVLPRASRDEIAGWDGSTLRVRLKAPPVEGKANEALLRFLSATLSVPLRDLAILTGTTKRTKRVAIAGILEDDLVARLGLSG
jgi:uncharacterized protein (TIGR00251 family)